MKLIKIQNPAIKTLYLVVQYLSNAALCYLSKQENDSHLNLRFSAIERNINVVLSEDPRNVLSFNYTRLTLEWTNSSTTKIMRLNGAKHKDILRWIRKVSKESGYEKKYSYLATNKLKFPITDTYLYAFPAVDELDRIMKLWTSAYEAIGSALKHHNIRKQISLKPYSLCSSVKVEYPLMKNTLVDFGFAIPDEFSDEHYYYIKCYGVKRILWVSNMKPLKVGYWINKGFQGAILPAKDITKEMVKFFLKEVLEAFQNKLEKRSDKHFFRLVRIFV